ncbi:hypothetical protein Bbelb_269650 [Branchiostoma belcheri]|nr:hypothetical protein Bbelb_269650 [Branchiostoma belcheri]
MFSLPPRTSVFPATPHICFPCHPAHLFSRKFCFSTKGETYSSAGDGQNPVPPPAFSICLPRLFVKLFTNGVQALPGRRGAFKTREKDGAKTPLFTGSQENTSRLVTLSPRPGRASPPLAGPRRHSAEIRWEVGISKLQTESVKALYMWFPNVNRETRVRTRVVPGTCARRCALGKGTLHDFPHSTQFTPASRPVSGSYVYKYWREISLAAVLINASTYKHDFRVDYELCRHWGLSRRTGAKQNCAGGVEERRGRSRFFAGAKQNGAGAKQNGGGEEEGVSWGRRDLIVRTPRGTPPVAGIPPGHISYVTDQMNRINPGKMCDLTDHMITTNSALRIGQYKTSSENLLGTCRVPAGYRPKRPMPARLLNPAGASRGYIPDGHRRTVLDKVRLFAQARFWIVRTYPESRLRLICVLGCGEIIQNHARHLLRAYTYLSSDKDKRRTKIKHVLSGIECFSTPYTQCFSNPPVPDLWQNLQSPYRTCEPQPDTQDLM